MSTNSLQDGISFILCCYNSENLIEDTLYALHCQTNGDIPFEVILVDNNCTDNTVQLAKELWRRKDAELVVVSEKKPGLTHARRRGSTEARFPFVSFVDDDNIIEKNWAVKIFNLFNTKHSVGAIGSRNKPLIKGNTPFWFEKYQEGYACGSQLPSSGYATENRRYLWGGGLSIRTALLKTILAPSFPMLLGDRTGKRILSGGDSEICLRCILTGWDLWYEDNLTMQHKIPSSRLNWNYFCRLHYSFGYSQPIFSLYHDAIKQYPQTYFIKRLVIDFLNFLKLLSKYNYKLLGQQEGEEFQRQFYFRYGAIRSYLAHLGNYRDLFSMIQSFVTKYHGISPN